MLRGDNEQDAGFGRERGEEGVMRLFFDLVVGYYYVTYRKTHCVLFSVFDGVRLAILCLRDRKTWFLDV